MDYEKLTSLVDRIASDFLFLSSRELDIPTAGGFLNILEGIIDAAGHLGLTPLHKVGSGLNHLLEQTIMDNLGDKAAGFDLFERGISLMQEILRDSQQRNGFERLDAMESYLRELGDLTGYRPAAEAAPPVSATINDEAAHPEGAAIPKKKKKRPILLK